MKQLLTAVCFIGLAGCGLLTPDPNAEIRDRATDYLQHFNDDPPWPFEVIRAGEVRPWRQQDENVQTAIRQQYTIRRQRRGLALDSTNVAREVLRLKSSNAPEIIIQPFQARYNRLLQEARQLGRQQDSLRRFLRNPMPDTTQIGSAIWLVYRSKYFPEQKTGTFVVLKDGPVYKEIGPREFN